MPDNTQLLRLVSIIGASLAGLDISDPSWEAVYSSMRALDLDEASARALVEDVRAHGASDADLLDALQQRRREELRQLLAGTTVG